MSASVPGPQRTTPVKCGSCNRPMNSPLFCANCRTLYPADGCHYFELFGLEPAYDLDVGELRRRYLQCARDIHPDRHGGSAGEAVSLSLELSARLNEAYRVLADPVLRAEYLLELVGGRSSAEDKTVPQEVLSQALLLREQIEEARAAADQAALESCQRQARQLYDQAVAGIAQLARGLPGTDETRRQLRQKLNAVKYFHKLREQF